MMSNELIMDLFEYYDFYSLFWSFCSLNARFDALLTRCDTDFDLDRVAPANFIHFLAHILPQINRYRIRSLHASNIHHTFCFAHDKSLVHFDQIRSLRLGNTSVSVIRHMVERVHFHRLESISLDQDQSESDSSWCSKHFLDSNRYHRLKTYRDPFGCFIEGTSVLPLEYMIIEYGNWNTFLNLLRRSPHLKSLQTGVWFEYDGVRPSPMQTNNVLIRLHLTFESNIPISILMNLFQHVPRLQKLHVTNYGSFGFDYTLVDPHWWENVLSKCLPELKRLYLRMSSRDHNPPDNPLWPVDLEEHTVREQIEKSSYWRTHKWQLKYQKHMPTAQDNYHKATFEVN